ncbi:hypothetical protein TNCV_2605281 [Trichonephila clavipes]|nr:hypothetical protein TNCV_2605281 [Trichonephila clavipes]
MANTTSGVADAVGVARSAAGQGWNRFQETGNVRHRPGVGRATRHSHHQLMAGIYIAVNSPSKQNRECRAAQRQLFRATGRSPSSQTVRNRLLRRALCT